MKNNAVGHYTKDTQIQSSEFCMVARTFRGSSIENLLNVNYCSL